MQRTIQSIQKVVDNFWQKHELENFDYSLNIDSDSTQFSYSIDPENIVLRSEIENSINCCLKYSGLGLVKTMIRRRPYTIKQNYITLYYQLISN